jgi:acetyl-CoA carboxylase biotin carboxyl carrier protein
MEPSVKDIQEILAVFLDSELQELRLEIGNVRLAVSKGGGGGSGMQPFASASMPLAATPPAAVRSSVATSVPPVSPASQPSPSAPRAAVKKKENWVAVTAPTVGTFYRCPAPHQPPFVQVGSEVSANDTLCLIEVMKMFTSVTAPCKGRVVEIVVEDAGLVEHGQTLIYIEPT